MGASHAQPDTTGLDQLPEIQAVLDAAPILLDCHRSRFIEPAPWGERIIEHYWNGNVRLVRMVSDAGCQRLEFGYYPDGTKRLEILAWSRNAHGSMTEWYPTGTLKSTARLWEVENDGWLYQWNEDGSLIRKDLFRHNQWVRGKAFH